MNSKIYGVDSDEKITPLKVRDAIMECFFEAHCQDSQVDQDDEKANRLYCKEIVKKSFADSGGDFDNPTKSSLAATVGELVEFSKNFRDPSIITKHKQEIEELIAQL